MQNVAALAFWLIAAHFVLDFPLQGNTTAKEKSHLSNTELQREVPWYYWMTAHTFMHGAAVAFILGSVFLGVLETVLHFIIDRAKCSGLISIHTDQTLHLACKLVWLTVATAHVEIR